MLLNTVGICKMLCMVINLTFLSYGLRTCVEVLYRRDSLLITSLPIFDVLRRFQTFVLDIFDVIFSKNWRVERNVKVLFCFVLVVSFRRRNSLSKGGSNVPTTSKSWVMRYGVNCRNRIFGSLSPISHQIFNPVPIWHLLQQGAQLKNWTN